MSALPPKADIHRLGCPLCAKSGLMHRSKISLFDHLVGVGKQHRRHGEAKHSGSLGVDDQIELAGLHHGQVRGLGALEDAAGIDTELAKRIHDVGSITHQPANLDKVGRRIDRRDTPGGQESVGPDVHGIGPIAPDILEGAIDLATGAGLRTWTCSPIARAAASTSRNIDAVFAVSAGLTSTATRTARGSRSCSRSSRFAANSPLKKLIPVRLPPGRARLATRPSLTGSWATIKAIGIVVVAALAAGAAVVALAAITVTCRRTSSAANSGSRSFWSSAKR